MNEELKMSNDFNYSAQARTNPVFQTAKTAVCLMARAGIPDADKILHCLKLDDNQPLKSMTDSDTILGNAIVVETKYRTMCSLIENSGYHTCVDLPCGCTPKALHLTEKGFRFIGMDLPIIVREFAPIINSIATHPNAITFCEVDATNYESLEQALRDIDEPICISTEGMLMYFSDDEVDAVISNIRRLLEIHGGCWITPDPEIKLQFMLTFHSVFGESSVRNLEKTGSTASKQSDVANLFNSFILNVENLSDSIKTAENLLRSHGLKVERINLAENLPELSVYRQLTSAQIKQFKDAMQQCHYWLMTLDESQNFQDNVTVQKNLPFEMKYTFENGVLQMTLRGRMDSISAPNILTTFEKEKLSDNIDEVKIDCSELEYISSAGIRVFFDIHKNCNKGLVLFNVNLSVTKILLNKGFTEFGVNKWKLSKNF